MKYVVMLGDGMADYPIPSLDNKTPLEVANKPMMDELCKNGELGLVRTLYEGMPTGSDIANLSVLGYDPKKYYTGRSPIEALGLGIALSDEDTVFRLNLVSISTDGEFESKTMLDHSSDKITNEEAYELLCVMEEKLLAVADVGKTFAEIYALKMQARMLVDEIVMREVVNVFH